jgi:hypothetical protein
VKTSRYIGIRATSFSGATSTVSDTGGVDLQRVYICIREEDLMPFKSKAQQRYMFATKPGIAREMAAKTPSFADLPERVGAARKVKAKGKGSALKRAAMRKVQAKTRTAARPVHGRRG